MINFSTAAESAFLQPEDTQNHLSSAFYRDSEHLTSQPDMDIIRVTTSKIIEFGLEKQ